MVIDEDSIRAYVVGVSGGAKITSCSGSGQTIYGEVVKKEEKCWICGGEPRPIDLPRKGDDPPVRAGNDRSDGDPAIALDCGDGTGPVTADAGREVMLREKGYQRSHW